MRCSWFGHGANISDEHLEGFIPKAIALSMAIIIDQSMSIDAELGLGLNPRRLAKLQVAM